MRMWLAAALLLAAWAVACMLFGFFAAQFLWGIA